MNGIPNELDEDGVYIIERMTQVDVPEVSRLERKCFSNPWPQSAYRRELRNPAQNYYIVLRDSAAPAREGVAFGPDAGNGEPSHRMSRMTFLSRVRRTAQEVSSREGSVVGFAGFWHLFDEAHITTIGVEPDLRGRSLGELLLVALTEEAIARGAGYLSLEVRVSNHVALRLYEKYGFQIKGVRPKYYIDNGEDAYVMWSDSIREPRFRVMLDERRDGLEQSLGGIAELPPAAWMPFSRDALMRDATG